jgi:DNA-binding MarR family transcriptional regulator
MKAAPSEVASEPGCGLLLMRLARAVGNAFGGSLEQLGIRSHHFAVLHELDASGAMSQQELGDALNVHASNLVHLVDELEETGLVVRGRDARDRRRYLLVLTPEGKRVLQRAHRAAETAERDLLAGLSPAERRELHAMLARACPGKADHAA